MAPFASQWPARNERRLPRLVSRHEHQRLVRAFRESMPMDEETEPNLAAVVRDALHYPGSLVRAQLVYGLAHRAGVDDIVARRAAVAVEYFHTASLIFDDLPSMDNASERRGRTCPHLLYGEAAATLGALALINQGYALLWEAINTLPEDRRTAAAQLVAKTFGPGGLLNGQAMDLQFQHGQHRAADVLRVAQGKTVPLIQLTLILPTLLAGATAESLTALERLASLWGLAYQVIDDFKDCLLSQAETGKTTAQDLALGRPNLPAQAGWKRALATLDDLLDEASTAVVELAKVSPEYELLARLHKVLEGERERITVRLDLPHDLPHLQLNRDRPRSETG